MAREQLEIIDVEAKGLLGKPGTLCHTANLGCFLILVAFAALCYMAKS